MMFLLPVGGIVDYRFGIMTTPGHKGVPVGITAGMKWAADNQAFTPCPTGLYGQAIEKLSPLEDHRYKGMIYWNENALVKLAELAEIPS